MATPKLQAFAYTDIGNPEKEFNQDSTMTEQLVTPAGLELQVSIVADGVSKREFGVLASKKTIDTIIEHLKTSDETNIPRLLTQAIKMANQVVRREVPDGNSTVAVAVIHLNSDDEFGRLYIASVGDSPIMLARRINRDDDIALVRLNVNHTRATDLALQRQIGINQMNDVNRGTALTRAIGIHEDVDVDIGLYMTPLNGHTDVNVVTDKVVEANQVADKRGREGLMLEHYDTVFVCSDGLTDGLKTAARTPFVAIEDFTDRALYRDPQRMTKELIEIAIRNSTIDNCAMAVMFYDGPRRKQDIASARLNRSVVLIAAALLTLVAFIGGVAFLGQRAENQRQATLAAQEIAAINETATQDRATVIAIETRSSLPTPTPLPPTPTRTPTPRPSPTVVPTIDPSLFANPIVGRQYTDAIRSADQAPPIEEGQPYPISVLANFVLDGNESEAEPANLFVNQGSAVEIDRFEKNRRLIEVVVGRDSALFFESGAYRAGDNILFSLEEDLGVRFMTDSVCAAVRYLDESRIAFSCFGADAVCSLQGTPNSQIGSEQVLIWNVPNRAVESIDTIDYETADFFNRLTEPFRAQEINGCVSAIIDTDGDAVKNAVDLCPDEGGALSTPRVDGCLDNDEDTIPNKDDQCVDLAGTAADDGCPPDSDGDGKFDDQDACPFEYGSLANGCPNDTDGDGLDIAFDACPQTYGSLDNGCPNDPDGDGIDSMFDVCPNQAGNAEGARRGCPRPEYP
jgi:serine/threonine protein phosphatase PrpC